MSDFDGVLDTKILIGLDAGTIAENVLPVRPAVSAMTLAELRVGVLFAETTDQRGLRLETLSFAERNYEPLRVTEEIARRFSEIVAALRSEGRRAPVIDALIGRQPSSTVCRSSPGDAHMAALPGVNVIFV